MKAGLLGTVSAFAFIATGLAGQAEAQQKTGAKPSLPAGYAPQGEGRRARRV